jgi:hypothetical protein
LALPGLLRWRRLVQGSRRVPDSEVIRWTCGRFETPLLDSPLARRVNPMIERYRRLVLKILATTGA